MFAVYHEDKYTRYCLKLCESIEEAREYVNTNYGHRIMPNRDRVLILDDAGLILEAYQVDYMAQFEALKTWTFPSSSSSAVYETRLTKTGILSCNCRGWTFKKKDKPRSCKHVDEVIFKERLAVKEVGQYWVLEDSKIAAAKKKYASGNSTPQQRFAALIVQYESAINRMAQLDPKYMWKMAEEVELLKFKVEAYMVMLEEKGIDGMAMYEAAQAKLGAILQ